MIGGPGACLIGKEEEKEILDVLHGGYLFRYGTEGEDGFQHKVVTFEKEMAERLHQPYLFATSSGTGALMCCLSALGVGAGDEVIVPGFTFIASIVSILLCNAMPVLAEIDESLNMDPTKLEALITPRTKAIMPVHNFIIHLNQPDPEILYALAEIECTILNKKACEESADGYLIGTGGYKVTEWVPGDKVEMEKFDDSFVWTEEGTTPTRTLTIKCMTEGSISAVQAGDVANALCAKEDLSYLNEDANVETLTFRTWGVWMLAMNQHEGSVFYDDPNLQKAVVAAFDRNMMCQFVNGEGDEAPDSLFPYYMFGYTNEYEFAKFDLDKAKEYLAASNHPDGNVTVRVLTHTNANYTAQVTVLQSMLETNLGIKVDVQQLDKAGRNAALSEGTSYDIYLMDYTAAPNGSKLQNRFELGNAADWANYSNPEIDQLYLDYLSTNDEEAQKTALARIQEIGAEELPYVPYAYQTCPVVYAKGVSGLNWKTSTKFDFHRVVWEEA